ncbi:acetylglutamate kinase [Amedibacillus sp. YH-ame10]
MKIDPIQKATILSQALPYIQKYNGKIVVVKYGGNAMKNEELKMNVMTDIVLLSEVGIHVVLVHGGGPEINHMLNKVGKKSEFIAGLRHTDDETMDIVQMVLAGKTNKDLVSLINQKGARAVGLSGMDANIIHAKKYEVEEGDLGFVGEIEEIDERLILDVIEKGYIPVIASVGCDADGHSYNINADTAASSIAAKLNAENMILVSDIPGVLFDPKDESSLISKIYLHEVEYLKESGVITGGMIPKVECCVNAVHEQVRKAVIIDGRVPHSILIEMFSEDGIGTMFEEGEVSL